MQSTVVAKVGKGSNPKTTLYVGGLEATVNEAALHAAFLPFGEVKEVSLPMDHATGTHRGFGFVEFEASEDAAAAMDNMHNSELYGRVLRVNYAQPNKIKGGDKGFATQAVWADADDWYEKHIAEEELDKLSEQQGKAAKKAAIDDSVVAAAAGAAAAAAAAGEADQIYNSMTILARPHATFKDLHKLLLKCWMDCGCGHLWGFCRLAPPAPGPWPKGRARDNTPTRSQPKSATLGSALHLEGEEVHYWYEMGDMSGCSIEVRKLDARLSAAGAEWMGDKKLKVALRNEHPSMTGPRCACGGLGRYYACGAFCSLRCGVVGQRAPTSLERVWNSPRMGACGYCGPDAMTPSTFWPKEDVPEPPPSDSEDEEQAEYDEGMHVYDYDDPEDGYKLSFRRWARKQRERRRREQAVEEVEEESGETMEGDWEGDEEAEEEGEGEWEDEWDEEEEAEAGEDPRVLLLQQIQQDQARAQQQERAQQEQQEAAADARLLLVRHVQQEGAQQRQPPQQHQPPQQRQRLLPPQQHQPVQLQQALPPLQYMPPLQYQPAQQSVQQPMQQQAHEQQPQQEAERARQMMGAPRPVRQQQEREVSSSSSTSGGGGR